MFLVWDCGWDFGLWVWVVVVRGVATGGFVVTLVVQVVFACFVKALLAWC